MMMKGFKIRLLPNQEQEDMMWKHIYGCRFIWNYMLNLQKERYKNGEKHLSGFDMCKVLTPLKKLEKYAWLNEISNHSMQLICQDLAKAYDKFFKKLNNNPKFKSKKKAKKTYPIRCDAFYFKNSLTQISKLGKVKFQTNYKIPEGKGVKFYNPRISLVNKKWILSFSMECENQTPILTDKSMGIDLGIKETAVVSFGNESFVYHNINKSKRVRKLEDKKKHIQRIISRKYCTNGNYEKTQNIIKYEKILKEIYYKLSNIRNNYIHQITHKLISLLPKQVIMEDLNISGMMKNRHLSRAIAEQCLYEFIRQMRYKCERAGIEFIQVPRFYPSSKTCSECGLIKKDLKLSDRTFVCECGFKLDRDLNAAKNLEKYIG